VLGASALLINLPISGSARVDQKTAHQRVRARLRMIPPIDRSGNRKGPLCSDPLPAKLVGMKSSPGKGHLRVIHRLRGFRKTTVFRYRNQAYAKKPQTGAG
jgi:hypothetical protein